MTSTTGLRSRLQASVGSLTAALFLALVVAQAPHLVHHLFEPEQHQSECAFASGAERTQALTPDLVTLAPADLVQATGPVAADAQLPGLALSPADPRAPPLFAS
jgi:hypothetical protein